MNHQPAPSLPSHVGITAPRGFRAAGMHAGIRASGKKDLAVILADGPASAAAVFTTNRVQAAPVQVTRENLAQSGGALRAVVVNSGVANACTGTRGLADARAVAAGAAAYLGIPAQEVAVASTGLIGAYLPMDSILDTLPRCLEQASAAGHGDAAEAIMTTDAYPKEAVRTCRLADGTQVTLGAMAKGAGMIHPNMATMLCFAATDAQVTPAALQQAVTTAVDTTFNMMTVDGDTSTNDMVLMMARGAAGGPVIDGSGKDYAIFLAALTDLYTELTRAIAADGEGASRLMEVRVEGAPSLADARRAGRAVTASTLVKAALFGGDANWGRIMMALGASGASFDPDRVDLTVGDVPVLAAGQPLNPPEHELARVLDRPEVQFLIHLNAGPHGATAWGCDLTHDYLKLNAEYRT